MVTVLEIKELVKGDLYGDKNLIINGAYDLIPGKESYVSFLSNGLSPQLLTTTLSDLIIVSDKDFFKDIKKSIIVVQDPKYSFFKIVKPLYICSTKNKLNDYLKITILYLEVSKKVKVSGAHSAPRPQLTFPTLSPLPSMLPTELRPCLHQSSFLQSANFPVYKSAMRRS